MDYQFAEQKKLLIRELKNSNITNQTVLEAISNIPREIFTPENLHSKAYANIALPIANNQTISQPYIVAIMTQTLLNNFVKYKKNTNNCSILEIGTGSGYQAAILATIFNKIYTVERIKNLSDNAKKTLNNLNLFNIDYKYADGNLGWPEKSPFDGIIVTCGAKKVPNALLEQLSPANGVMVIPVQEDNSYQQRLVTILRNNDQYTQEYHEYVSFVPFLPGTE